MLEFIRSRAKGWFAWVIVGLITVPFALWGIQNYVGGGGPGYVAKVAGQEISQAQFDSTYQQQRSQLEQMFGGQLPEIFTEQMLRAQVIEQLVEHEMVIQAAVAQRMRISDRQLADVIRGVSAFQENGEFSQDLYVNLLRRQGMTPAMFEQRVRRDLIAEQFESGFTAAGFVTAAAIDDFIRLDRQQRQVDWLRIAASDFLGQVNVSDEAVEAYYDSNSQRYQTPEQVKVDYLEIRADQIGESMEVDEDEIRIRYDARLDSYRSPQERRASHILIRVDEGASDAEIRRARERAEGILARIRQGEDFATLASTESGDPGSAREGGDLGYFGRGMMVPSFEDVAYAMEIDQVSELVRSPFGFHIIRLDAVRGGEVKPYEEMREAIHSEIRNEQAAQRYYDLAERLTTYTYEQPDTLSIAAEELGLTVQTSAFLTRQGGEGIGQFPKVISAAFSDDVVGRGVNSEPVEISREHLLVLRLNTHQPAAIRPLAEVRDSILSTLRQQRAGELAGERADAIVQAIQAGEAPSQSAGANGMAWQVGIQLQRDSQELEPQVVDSVFAMSRPVAGKPGVEQVVLGNGDQVVTVLHQVVDGDPASAEPAQRERAEQLLLQADAKAISEALLADIREKTDITIRR